MFNLIKDTKYIYISIVALAIITLSTTLYIYINNLKHNVIELEQSNTQLKQSILHKDNTIKQSNNTIKQLNIDIEVLTKHYEQQLQTQLNLIKYNQIAIEQQKKLNQSISVKLNTKQSFKVFFEQLKNLEEVKQ